LARIVRQGTGASLAVVDIGGSDGDLFHQCGIGISADMGLEAVNRRLALVFDPMRIAVVLARRSDDRRIDKGASLDLDRLRLELAVNDRGIGTLYFRLKGTPV